MKRTCIRDREKNQNGQISPFSMFTADNKVLWKYIVNLTRSFWVLARTIGTIKGEQSKRKSDSVDGGGKSPQQTPTHAHFSGINGDLISLFFTAFPIYLPFWIRKGDNLLFSGFWSSLQPPSWGGLDQKSKIRKQVHPCRTAIPVQVIR